jgi:hypothetical protein
MTIAEFRSRLSGVIKVGEGWSARCPAHEDKRRSLSIGVGAEDRILLRCHAGCASAAIVEALGLKLADLFADSSASSRRIAATYDYCDERGELLYQVVRFDPKDFRQRRPDGKGDWIWNLDGVQRVLYGLPELQGQEAAAIVEGEKDSEAARAQEIPATCNVGGAGKWRDEYSQQLKAAGIKRIVVIPDNDEPGRKHADAVARSCHAAGLAAKICTLPDGLKDVSDYLTKHKRDELISLLRNAEPFEPAPGVATAGLTLTALRDLLAEPDETVQWIVSDRIPAGGVVMLAGKPKAGKSTIARACAFAVASGHPWLGWTASQGPVWYVALEEKRSELRRLFRAMGGPPDVPIRLFIGRAPEDLLEQLHETARRERPVLIVIDTLQRLIRCQDLNDYAQVTTKMDPLLSLARETGAALLLVHHASKSARSGIDAVLGSTALSGSVDNVMVLGRVEQARTLCTIQRIGDDLDETIVTLDKASQHVELGLKRQEAEQAEVASSILAALRTTPDLTERELSGHVEGRTEVKRAALRKLLADEKVGRSGAGKRNDPFRYRLPDSAPVSCSLVPRDIREQENTNQKIELSGAQSTTYSCSQESGDLASEPETREQVFEPSLNVLRVPEDADAEYYGG